MSKPSEFQFSNETVPPEYERYYRPRIFDPCALVLLDRAELAPGMRVLDVATGPGTVARIAAARVGAGGAVTGTDISAPMLKIARSKPDNGAPIEYITSPAAPLAVGNDAFDVVICQQGVQFFPDRIAALKEMRRALRAGGRVAIAAWCEIESCPMFFAFSRALREAGQPELADLYGMPFTLPAETLARELKAAGFGGLEISRVELPLVFEGGAAQAVTAISASPVAPMIAALPQAAKDAFFTAAQRNAREFVKNGEFRTHMTTTIAVATRE